MSTFVIEKPILTKQRVSDITRNREWYSVLSKKYVHQNGVEIE